MGVNLEFPIDIRCMRPYRIRRDEQLVGYEIGFVATRQICEYLCLPRGEIVKSGDLFDPIAQLPHIHLIAACNRDILFDAWFDTGREPALYIFDDR